jgi:hypothetical protein
MVCPFTLSARRQGTTTFVLCLRILHLVHSGPAAADNVDRHLGAAVEECRAGTPSPGREVQLFETASAVCFAGRFELGIEERIISLLKDDRKVFVVRSVGGSAITAARVGLHLLDKRVDVAVYDVCFSACANWVFLAGRRKYVADGTVLAWHGAPRGTLSARVKLLDSTGMLVITHHLSGLFFARAAVDPALATAPDTASFAYPAWQTRATKAGSSLTHGWTWRLADLERFGVTGIVCYPEPSKANDLRRIAASHNIDLLVP